MRGFGGVLLKDAKAIFLELSSCRWMCVVVGRGRRERGWEQAEERKAQRKLHRRFCYGCSKPRCRTRCGLTAALIFGGRHPTPPTCFLEDQTGTEMSEKLQNKQVGLDSVLWLASDVRISLAGGPTARISLRPAGLGRAVRAFPDGWTP